MVDLDVSDNALGLKGVVALSSLLSACRKQLLTLHMIHDPLVAGTGLNGR